MLVIYSGYTGANPVTSIFFERRMNTKDIGLLTEAKVLLKFIEFGYKASIPYGENSRYDLIVDNGKLYRVQCKTARLSRGNIVANAYSQYGKGDSMVRKRYTKEEIDLVAIYYPPTDQVYIIGGNEIGRHNVYTLTFEQSIFRPNTKLASDFEFEKVMTCEPYGEATACKAEEQSSIP